MHTSTRTEAIDELRRLAEGQPIHSDSAELLNQVIEELQKAQADPGPIIPSAILTTLREIADHALTDLMNTDSSEPDAAKELDEVIAAGNWLDDQKIPTPGTSQTPSQGEPGQTVIPPEIYVTLRNALDIASDGRRIFIDAEAWLDTFTLKKAEQSEPAELTVKVNPSEQQSDQPDLPCVRRFPTTERDRQIVQLAIEQCDQDGVCEVDTDAMISEAAGAEGCYVQAWVWTAFDGKVEPLPAVEMPPKSALKCGCEHHGIMSGCPVHGSAPSPFNINPEGNPQL